MKIQRTKNAARNIAFDGLLKLFTMLVPFLLRRVMLQQLGAGYLGLSGLFRSVLSFLNLAELGVGGAIVYSMYRPIAAGDTASIRALLRLYRGFCRVIGLVIAAAGLALTPFLPALVKGDVPPGIDLYILYYMNLGSTVLTYWCFAYKGCLLTAHQRVDVASRIKLGVSLAEYALKFAALIWFRNFYLYLLIQLLAQIAGNLVTAYFVGKLFPEYSPEGRLPREQVSDISRHVRDFFTAKFSHVISESADTVVVSAFLGLTVLAVYQNYFYVIVSLRGFLEVAVTACIAGVGNSLVTESKKKNYRDLRRYSLLFNWVMGVSTPMLLCLYQPFMEMWMGRKSLLPPGYVICFAVYYYTVGMNKILNMFKDAAGIWHRDRFRPLTAAVVNLSLNLLTVRRFGLYGVLLSTVVSMAAVQIPWLLHNLFSEIYPRENLREYVRELCLPAALTLLSCVIAWLICSRVDGRLRERLLICGAVSFAVPSLLFCLVLGRNKLLRKTVIQLWRTLMPGQGGEDDTVQDK